MTKLTFNWHGRINIFRWTASLTSVKFFGSNVSLEDSKNTLQTKSAPYITWEMVVGNVGFKHVLQSKNNCSSVSAQLL